MISSQLYSQDTIKINKDTLQNKNIISNLAWAAGHNLSYSAALRSLVAHNIPLLFRILTYCVNPYAIKYLKRRESHYKRRKIKWLRPFFRSAVESAITDLEMGYSLSSVLQEHLKWWLPEYYINSVRLAEEKDCVRETLIELGQTNHSVRQRKKEIFSVMLYPFITIGAGALVLWFLMVFIIPKFKRIFDDLLGGEPLPALTEFVVGMANYFVPESPFLPMFILQVPALLYYCFCTHRADWILIKIPFFRRPILRWTKLETIQALSVYLKMNISLPEALDLINESLPASSFKRKFKKLNTKVISGQDLATAWKEVFPKDSNTHFYIKNGLQNDTLPESLDELGQLLQDEDNRAHQYFLKSIEPTVIFMTSLVVAIIVISMFLPMIKIINEMVRMAQ